MKPGSVIVDLAAEQGGNCELTEPGEVVDAHGVTIIGYTDLPSRLAGHGEPALRHATSSHLLDGHGRRDARSDVDMDDEVIRGALVVARGRDPAAGRRRRSRARRRAEPPRSPRPPRRPERRAAAACPPATGTRHGASDTTRRRHASASSARRRGALVLRLRSRRRRSSQHFTVFVLACFVGWQVVWNVTPALHTPLMSVTNAISGIIVVGGMLQIGGRARIAARRSSARVAVLHRDDQHGRRLPRHAAHAEDVPASRARMTSRQASSPSPTSARASCSS